MIPRPRHAKDGPTVAENTAIAKSKVVMAPLRTLTPAMIDSIAASHARRGTPMHARLLAELSNMVEARRVNER